MILLSQFSVWCDKLGRARRTEKVDNITHPNFKRTMQQAFFEVAPIAWVDLPATSFDRFQERIVSEATIGSTSIAFTLRIYEVEGREDDKAFTVSISSTSTRQYFDTADKAKAYAFEYLHAYIASIIRPADSTTSSTSSTTSND